MAQKGYWIYDFFLPGMIIDALDSGNGERLAAWANEIMDNRIRTVNMLGCHDGIPLLDLKGLLPDERIEELIELLKARGGFVKDLHGQKNMYYQVNMTYFSALGEDEDKLLLARAIQLFMPGKPQVWYLDLFAGKNDYAAAAQAGAGGHKEINRSNLTKEQAEYGLGREIVQKQIELLRFRNTHPAFAPEAEVTVQCSGSQLQIDWNNKSAFVQLSADLRAGSFEISAS